MKTTKTTFKGSPAIMCGKCATIVETKVNSKYFPNGYHYDVCPKCKSELEYDKE